MTIKWITNNTFIAEDENVIVGFIGIMKGLAYNVEGYSFQIMALAVLNNR